MVWWQSGYTTGGGKLTTTGSIPRPCNIFMVIVWSLSHYRLVIAVAPSVVPCSTLVGGVAQGIPYPDQTGEGV